MSISHVIAHHLQCMDGKVALTLREEEMSVEGQAEQLLQKLKSSFLSRISRKHGSFAKDNGELSALPEQLQAVLANDISFYAMTVSIMQAFESVVKKQNVAINSHFIFVIDYSSIQHVFYLFIVCENEALAISDSLEVEHRYFVDSGPSLFGVKLDITEWQSDSQYAYLTIVPPRNDKLLSEFFDQLTGFSNGVDKQESTLSFLQGIEAYAKQLPDEKVENYRAQVVDYCISQDEKDEPVNIAKLSEALDDIDRAQFTKEIMHHHSDSSDEVLIDRRSMKKYVKFFGRDKDLSISFSTNHLNSRVHYNPDKDQLIIDGVPRSLRNQLMKYIDSQSNY